MTGSILLIIISSLITLNAWDKIKVLKEERLKIRIDLIELELAKREKRKKALEELKRHSLKLSMDGFISMRSKTLGVNPEEEEMTGVFVIHNDTKNKQLVGKGISMFEKVNEVFNENEQLKADLLSGDSWTIELLSLSDSRYKSLNTMEEHFIEHHNAYEKGYNKADILKRDTSVAQL